MGGVSLTVSAVVGGFFGMNLVSGLEVLPGGLWLALTGALGMSSMLMYMLTGGVRRFYVSQNSSARNNSTPRAAAAYLS